MKKISQYLFYIAILILGSVTQVYSQTIIQMEEEYGVYKIPCEINGLKLKLIFDTGASNVCISESVAIFMYEQGYLRDNDIAGVGTSQVADGRIVDNTIVNIRELKIGSYCLKDIEAVVIHSQKTPLLLGMSAIQQLGEVSIIGNQLIIRQDSYSTTNNNIEYTDEEIDKLLDSAIQAKDNELYELAVEYFNILHNAELLDLEGKLHLASCLRMADRYKEAIDIHKEIEQEIVSADDDTKRWTYYGMMSCYFYLENYDYSILYGQKALTYADYNYEAYDSLIYTLAMSYLETNKTYKSKEFIKDEINKYLLFKDYQPTDCWNKKIDDKVLGGLYATLSMYYWKTEDNMTNVIKYIILAAAWGNETAIEYAESHNIIFNKNPKNYKY